MLTSLRRLERWGLDRALAVWLGAIALVALGVLSPERALAAVDGSTLVLLLGMMGMGAFLAVDGFFDDLERWLTARVRTPRQLLRYVIWGSGLLAALITNDAVCVLGAPVVVRLIRRHSLPPLPFLLALATSANTGSVATLVGNPQNMLCAMFGGLSYAQHLAAVGPIALLGLALNELWIATSFRDALATSRLEPVDADGPRPSFRAHRATLAILAGTVLLYGLGANLAFTSAAGFLLMCLVRRHDPRRVWPEIDFALLVFFAGLFIAVAGLEASGLPRAFFREVPLRSFGAGLTGRLGLASVFLVGSNIVSNVPFILLVREGMETLDDRWLGWELLAVASTFAGNLTLLGSVANVIVAEAGRDVGGMSFGAYLKVGAPLAIMTTLVGVTWLVGWSMWVATP